MKKHDKTFNNNSLDMVHASISDATISELFNVADYLHSPEIDDDLVLIYSSEEKIDGKSQTVLVFSSGNLVRTAQSAESLFDDYGLIHEIEEWSSFQKTMAYLIEGAVQHPPYATLHSVFLKINADCLINLNYISGYERSKRPGQYDTHTDVTLSTGAIVEVSLGYKSFHKKFHEGALILIALRKLFRFTYRKEKRFSIYKEPSILNPYLLIYLREQNLEGFNIPMKAFKKAYCFFETTEKMLKDIEITPEILAQFDDITKEIILKTLINKKERKRS